MHGRPLACLPVDSVRLTAVPGVTWVPPLGFCVSTVPRDAVQLATMETDPTVRPADVIALRALVSSSLSTLGTATVAGVTHCVRVTAKPNGSCWPTAGSWPTTRPLLDAGQFVV